MKVVALAALCVLIALPAQAGQRQQQKNASHLVTMMAAVRLLASPRPHRAAYAHQSANRTTPSMPMATA